MRTKMLAAAVLCGSVLAGGCLETEQGYTLNPDGSGRLAFVVVRGVDMSPMGGQTKIKDPDEAARKTLEKMLSKSKGVDAWSDVSYTILEDGRIRIAGTAYFPDFSKLEMEWSGIDATWAKAGDGMVLKLLPSLGGQVKKPKATTREAEKLTPEQLKKQILLKRMEYQSSRPLLVAILGSAKHTATFTLPGTLMDTGALDKVGAHKVRVVLDGKKMIAALDTMATDDAFITESIKSGLDPLDNPANVARFSSLMFGKKAPMKAEVAGELEPVFDYKKDMKAAQDAMPGMLERLKISLKRKTPSGLMAPSEPAVPPGEGF